MALHKVEKGDEREDLVEASKELAKKIHDLLSELAPTEWEMQVNAVTIVLGDMIGACVVTGHCTTPEEMVDELRPILTANARQVISGNSN